MNATAPLNSSSILLEKGHHRGLTIIWLIFERRHDWLQKIKTLQDVKYSQTHSRWYLPYDKRSYNLFRQLQIPYTISGTHRADKLRGQAEPQDDKASIHIYKDVASACPSSAQVDADIHVTSVKMSWNGGAFELATNSNKKNIMYVNNLDPPEGSGNKKNYTKKVQL